MWWRAWARGCPELDAGPTSLRFGTLLRSGCKGVMVIRNPGDRLTRLEDPWVGGAGVGWRVLPRKHRLAPCEDPGEAGVMTPEPASYHRHRFPCRDHQPRRLALPRLRLELAGCGAGFGRAGQCGDTREHPPLAREVRQSFRDQAASAQSEAGRHLAPRRGIDTVGESGTVRLPTPPASRIDAGPSRSLWRSDPLNGLPGQGATCESRA